MTRNFLSIIFFIIATVSQAQTISPAILLRDSIYVDSTYKFVDADSMTFFLRGNADASLKWSLNINQEEGSSIPVLASEPGATSFGVKVSPDIFPRYRVELDEDSSVYIRGFVCLYEDEAPVDSLHLLFNVMPSRPRVKNVCISGTFDYQYYGYVPLADLSIEFTSNNMERCFLARLASDSMNVFEFPKFSVLIYEEVPYQDINGYIHKIEWPHADWGEYYTIMSCNEYGSALGDTICTTDFIDDENVLACLEWLRLHMSTDIANNYADNALRVSLNNGWLYINGYADTDIATYVYQLNGQLVHKSASDSKIDLNHLPKGVYIIELRIHNTIHRKTIIL